MKINPKPVLRTKKKKPQASSLRNLTPPQHLDSSGAITSTRTQEVGKSFALSPPQTTKRKSSAQED